MRNGQLFFIPQILVYNANYSIIRNTRDAVNAAQWRCCTFWWMQQFLAYFCVSGAHKSTISLFLFHTEYNIDNILTCWICACGSSTEYNNNKYSSQVALITHRRISIYMKVISIISNNLHRRHSIWVYAYINIYSQHYYHYYHYAPQQICIYEYIFEWICISQSNIRMYMYNMQQRHEWHVFNANSVKSMCHCMRV